MSLKAVSSSGSSLATPVTPANGGTGTSTVFTQGSVVFAGASGIYSQDNANFFWDATNHFLGLGTATPAARLNIAGNISASAWTTNGIGLRINAATYTDTTSSGTVATSTAHSILIPTLTASSATTYTNSSTFSIAGPPTASTNVTNTNPWALRVVTGNTNLVGGLALGSATALTVSQLHSTLNLTQIAALNQNLLIDGTHTMTANNAVAFVGYTAATRVSPAGFNNNLTADNIGGVVGYYAIPSHNSATGTITAVTGFVGNPFNGSTGTITDCISFNSIISLNNGTITNAYGFRSADLTVGTNNYGFYGNLSAGANKYNLYMIGTAQNLLSGNLLLTTKITTYNNVATVGQGVPSIYGSGRSTAQAAAVASVATYTVGAADGSFLISANALVTASTTHNFTVTCAYTDEGNTARTLTLTFSQLAGTLLTAITNVTGAGPYEGIPLHIRCKAATAITIATTGTFTSVTYNIEGYITQIG